MKRLTADQVGKIIDQIVNIAKDGTLPDGDTVNVSTLLWAERTCDELGISYDSDDLDELTTWHILID